MLEMPVLDTPRLVIRPFVKEDLNSIHQILDVDLAGAAVGEEVAKRLEERRLWLQWTVLNYVQLARLDQPPYGDRAVVLKGAGRLIGSVGYVPLMDHFGRLPYFAELNGDVDAPPGDDPSVDGPSCDGHLRTVEFGLFYAISPAFQGQGFAIEAARGLVAYAFKELKLKRIVATTSYENKASAAVMHRLGMRIEGNPDPDPPWLQVVGVLENWANSPSLF